MGRGVRLRLGADLLPLVPEASSAAVTGELVLVSGRSTPERALAGGAVRGKHAVLVTGEGAPGTSRAWFPLAVALRSAGAASVLVTDEAEDELWADALSAALSPRYRPAWAAGPAAPAASVSLLRVRTASLARMLEGTGVDPMALARRAAEPVRVDAVPLGPLTLTQRLDTREVGAPNVVAVLEGSDPDLRDEYVLYSAHVDHLGSGPPDASGDSIYNGADDDASGTAAVLEVAEAMASLPTAPRRSQIFLLVSGEEQGLWGSEYWADNPTVPVERVVAGLNADMVGRNWPDTIVAIGKEHSDLGATLERVSAEHPQLGITPIDDPWPEERFYFRSDHYNFARRGVPILFFFNGTHEDYHGLDDEPDRIDAEKAARVARLLFHLGLEIANADERPRWRSASYERIVTDPPGGGSR